MLIKVRSRRMMDRKKTQGQFLGLIDEVLEEEERGRIEQGIGTPGVGNKC
jgi:uncharacterized protein YrrD